MPGRIHKPIVRIKCSDLKKYIKTENMTWIRNTIHNEKRNQGYAAASIRMPRMIITNKKDVMKLILNNKSILQKIK